MMLPLRGSRHALTIAWDLDDLVLSSDDLNKSFEEMWLSLLSVLVERWPDWPIEIWTRLVPVLADETSPDGTSSSSSRLALRDPTTSTSLPSFATSLRGSQS